MLDSLDNTRLTLALAVGLGLIVAGLGNTLVAPTRWRGQLAFALAGVAAAAATAWLFDERLAGWVAGGGVGALALLTAARAARGRAVALATAVAAPFRSARARWAAVAAVGTVGLGYEMVRFDRSQDAALAAGMAEMEELTGGAEGVPASGVRLLTDRGTAITPLVSPAPRPVADLVRSEARALAGMASHDQLIRRGQPSDDSNCHGWVFAGGRYAVGGRQVDAILADHGYVEVPHPAAGDLCVYRNLDETVAHTAVVRAVCDDGTVLVEGKWGRLGVYLHPARSSCYGSNFRYHHTARGSHALASVSDAPPVAVVQPSP